MKENELNDAIEQARRKLMKSIKTEATPEFESCLWEVCGILPDFLNNIDEDGIVKATGDRLAKKFALTQEQRCTVMIAIASLRDVFHIIEDAPENAVGYTTNLITHIVLKDWDGVEQMLDD